MNLINYQLRKMLTLKMSWWVILTFFLLPFLFIAFFKKQLLIMVGVSNQFLAPDKIFILMSIITQLFNVLLDMLIVLWITQDFALNMTRQKVIFGASRTYIFLETVFQIAVCVILSLILALGLSFAFVEFSDGIDPMSGRWDLISVNAPFIGGFLLHNCLSFSFIVLVTTIIRRSIHTLIAIFIWKILVEPVLGLWVANQWGQDVAKYLPSHLNNYLMGNLEGVLSQTTQPVIQWDIGLWAGAYTLVFLGVTHLIFVKSDL